MFRAFEKMLSLKSLLFCVKITGLSQRHKNFKNYRGGLLKEGWIFYVFVALCITEISHVAVVNTCVNIS